MDFDIGKKVLARFLDYVRIDTQADDQSNQKPSSPGQWDLLHRLRDELKGMGLADVQLNEGGVLWSRLPANQADSAQPHVAFIAHVDTYHGTSGRNVNPQVIENYDGKDIVLKGSGDRLSVQVNPDLANYVGETVITSDGTTLLGADDKAGVAEIMTLVEYLLAHPEIPRGPITVAFTPDEEIGRGTISFPPLNEFGAHVAYTVDGSQEGEVENETFCADTATVVLTGKDVHPGYAKGKMVNAVRAAAHLISLLPGDSLPETTQDKQGYLHPLSISGDVNEATIPFLVRDFEMDGLKQFEALLEGLCGQTVEAFPGLKYRISIQHSYKNMRYYLDKEPQAVSLAVEAMRRVGLEPLQHAIRGGTDGSRLSEMGLPTPNLFAGGRNFHSVNEWVPQPAMEKAVRVLVELTRLWAQAGR